MSGTRTQRTPRLLQRALLWSVVALGACAPSRQVLVETATEESASEVIVSLSEFGIAARKEKGTGRDAGWTVNVPSSKLPLAHRVLLTLGLPQQEHRGFESMLAETGVIPSKANEHARLVYATSEELAATLEQHERVVAARVHIVLPEESIGDRINSDRPKRPTASVMLRYVPQKGIDIAEEGGSSPRRSDEEAAPTQFQDAYSETLTQVFDDIQANSEGLLQQILTDIVRDSVGSIQNRVADRAEQIVGGNMSTLRSEIGTRLDQLRDEYKAKGDAPMRMEVEAMRKQLESSFDLMKGQLEASVRDTLDGFFRNQAEELGRDFTKGTRDTMASLVENRATQSQLAQTLGLQGDDPVEVKFFKLMLQDFYSLPQTIRRIAERRTETDPAGLPYPSDDVRMMVAHAVEGMWPWDVNVVFSPIDRIKVSASADGEGSEVELQSAELPVTGEIDPLIDTGNTIELEAKNQKLLYVAMALGGVTILLLVLLTRERSRNSSLRRQLATAGA